VKISKTFALITLIIRSALISPIIKLEILVFAKQS